MEKYTDQAVELIMNYGPKFILAIITLIIGLWLIKIFTRFFIRLLNKRDVDPSLKSFLKSLISITLKIALIISVVGMVGVQVTVFIALFASIGVGIGMALSGTLQNVAGGIFILFMKPFKVGDFIKVQGEMGTVREIRLFNTVLKTSDNKTVFVPNGQSLNGILINYSTEEKRRADLIIGIGYDDDIDKAKELIHQLIKADKRIIDDPSKPFVAVTALADSSVNFSLRLWVMAPDLSSVTYDMLEKIKKTFDANGISIPYPQQDVHLFKEKK